MRRIEHTTRLKSVCACAPSERAPFNGQTDIEALAAPATPIIAIKRANTNAAVEVVVQRPHWFKLVQLGLVPTLSLLRLSLNIHPH